MQCSVAYLGYSYKGQETQTCTQSLTFLYERPTKLCKVKLTRQNYCSMLVPNARNEEFQSLEPYMNLRPTHQMFISFSLLVSVNVVDGEVLHVTKVSRLHMGAYLCIASNGVPPSISKRVLLRVQCKYPHAICSIVM